MEEDTATDDERAIRQVVETWMDATKSGDLSTVLDLVTDDVLFTVPDREPFGKEEFAADGEGMEDVEFDGTSEVLEVEVFGDHAYIRNHIETTMTPPDGDPIRHSGHTLSILRKESDGRWRLARDANLVTVDE